MSRHDPIVEEVRKHRAAITRKHGPDIGAVLAALEQEPDDTPTVSLSPKLLPTRRRKRVVPSIRRAKKRIESTARS